MGRARRRSCAMADPWRPSSSPSPGRQADDRLDRGSARQPQRLADAGLRTQDRFGLASARADFAARIKAPAPPRARWRRRRGGPATAADRQWRRRRAHHRRSLRASVGGRQGHDDAQRRQHFGQDRRERADRNDAAAAHLPQSAAALGRAAAEPHARPGPCAKAGRHRADRPRHRAGIVRHAGQCLSRPQTGQDLARACASDADLLDVAALLWAMAQQIEDGDSTQAQRDLRAAGQACARRSSAARAIRKSRS